MKQTDDQTSAAGDPADRDGGSAVADDDAETQRLTPGALARPSAWSSTFAALAERDFAWYFAGNTAFFMGMQMNFVLRGFLAFDLTDAAFALGLVSASSALPMLVVAPLGGVISDRVNKRTLLVVIEAITALAILVVSALVLTGLIQFWHLLVSSVVTGSAVAVAMPARQVIAPQLVPQHRMMNAISLQMGGMNLTRILGPAVAGLLIAPLGIGVAYVVTGLLFALAMVTEFRLPVHGMRANNERRPFFEDLSGGFKYISHQPTIRLLILTGLLMPLFAFPVQQILPVFAEAVFDRGAIGLGLLAAMTGVGGLVGALIAANMDRTPQKGIILAAGGVLMGLFYIAFALSPFFLAALVFLAFGSTGRVLFMTTNNSTIQAIVPAEYRGRVMSVLMMSFGMMPLGVLPVSAAADVIGAPAAVTISSLVLLLSLFVLYAFSRTLRQLNIEALTEAEMSPSQAARLVAEGKISREEADRLTTSRASDDVDAVTNPRSSPQSSR